MYRTRKYAVGTTGAVIIQISYWKSIKIKTPYSYNIDIQSLKVGFFKRGGNVTALAENSSYSRCRAYITLT